MIETFDNEIVACQKLVNRNRSYLQVYHHRYFLGNDDEGDEEHYGDYLDLCVLKYGANGVLEVSPDFTNNRKPYTIELEHKKETFEYWIEHVSPLMDYDEQLRESVMQNEVFARHVQVLRQEVGDDFEKPPGKDIKSSST